MKLTKINYWMIVSSYTFGRLKYPEIKDVLPTQARE